MSAVLLWFNFLGHLASLFFLNALKQYLLSVWDVAVSLKTYLFFALCGLKVLCHCTVLSVFSGHLKKWSKSVLHQNFLDHCCLF